MIGGVLAAFDKILEDRAWSGIMPSFFLSVGLCGCLSLGRVRRLKMSRGMTPAIGDDLRAPMAIGSLTGEDGFGLRGSGFALFCLEGRSALNTTGCYE